MGLHLFRTVSAVSVLSSQGGSSMSKLDNSYVWFLIGCTKMYLMYRFVGWTFPLPLAEMEWQSRALFLSLTTLWGVETVIIHKIVKVS